MDNLDLIRLTLHSATFGHFANQSSLAKTLFYIILFTVVRGLYVLLGGLLVALPPALIGGVGYFIYSLFTS